MPEEDILDNTIDASLGKLIKLFYSPLEESTRIGSNCICFFMHWPNNRILFIKDNDCSAHKNIGNSKALMGMQQCCILWLESQLPYWDGLLGQFLVRTNLGANISPLSETKVYDQIFFFGGGAGEVDGVGGNNKRGLKWGDGGWGSLRNYS